VAVHNQVSWQMSSNDEDIGYIKSKLENIDAHFTRLESENKVLRDKMDAISNQLFVYRHFIIMLRATGVGLFFILTLKFGDVVDVISSWFSKGGS